MQPGDIFELFLSWDDDADCVRAQASWRGRRARGVLGPGFHEVRARTITPEGAVRSQRVVARRTPDDAAQPTVRQLGERLFSALPTEVRKLWALARERGAAADQRLHLQLSLDPALADVPWELLCEPDGGVFLAASNATSLSRTVEPTRPESRSRPSAATLRVLVFAASPDDQEPLDVDGETERIRKALAGRRVVVERVPGGDRESLFQSLAASPPDVLHWIGHGVLDAEHGGRLLLEAPGGGSESMRPEQLAELLQGGPSLVVLGTCDSARSGSGDALAAVAPTLARAGLPAVVAMRDAVRDDDAVDFAQVLYSSLAAGDDIASAVATARRSLLLHEAGDSGTWAIPVLYQRDLDVVTASWRFPAPTLPSRRRWMVGLAAGLLLAAAGSLWLLDAPWFADTEHDPRCPAAPGLDLPMVYLEPGSFDMGSTDGRTDERPIHRVTLREPFCLARFEVTVAQWNAVVPDAPREAEADLPVTHVSWLDAMHFVAELNRRVEGRPFRLPTEAEWEYAARAGTATPWSFGDQAADLLRHGNCNPAEGTDGFDRTAPVGSFEPNPWGLYDMHGNVTEWVADGYGPYAEDAAVDPRGAQGAEEKVRRGGNYRTREDNCRSARRFASDADARIYTTGFRLAAEPRS